MSKKNLNHDPDMVQDIGRFPLLEGYSESYIRLAQERVIFLSEMVTKETASELSALLLYYDNEDHNSPIVLYLNTVGGDAAGLVNIYDVMQMIKAPIKTICLGKCYSAGAVILAAGSKGERYACKNSKIMIHGIQCGFPVPGHDVINSTNYYDFLEENNDNIMKMLARHTGHTLDKIKKDCLRDVWLDAKQALDYGIIDRVIP